MKKIIVTMVLILGVQMGQAQTVKGIIRDFRGEKEAVCVRVPWLPIKILAMFGDDKASTAVRHINSIRVLELSDCSDEVKERFESKLQQLKPKDYEPLIAMKDDGSRVYMWGKIEDEVIRELVIGVTGDGDATLCCIKGNLTMDDLNVSMSKNNITLISGE